MDYQTRITPAKEEAVKALKDEFADYTGYIFTDYRGLTVEQITDLRHQLRKKEAAYRVVKNRFAKIAFKDLEHGGAEAHMVGPTAVALTKGEETGSVAKILFEFAKGGAPLTVKGAIVDGDLYDAAQIEAYSKLPTRLELISSLMGTMKAPVQKLAATLLAYVESKQGAAPAAAEAPAEAN
jgi:large subunit ribosomal protein L10